MEKLIAIAIQFLKQNDIPLNVKKSGLLDYGLANYDSKLKTISISVISIIEKAQQWNVDPTEFIILVMCHEIGHYFDEESDALSERITELLQLVGPDKSSGYEKELIQLVKKREVNAWGNGKKYVPLHLEREYDILNNLHLEYRLSNTEIQILKLKHNKEKTTLLEKLLKQSQEIKELRESNINLLEENFKLKLDRTPFDGQ